MRVLVTGGAGFIGSHIVDLLIERGHDVLIVDDLSNGKIGNMNTAADGKCRDINDELFLDDVKDFSPDAICHQAAQPSLRKSIDDPVFDARVNILGTLAVIMAARSVGAHIVMASTSAVYDPDGPLPYLEGDSIYPNLPYGIAKASAEMYLANSGLDVAILRYGNVYGPRQVPIGENQLIPHCLNHFLCGAPFVINGDGEQSRDFVYVGDVARANVDAIEKRVKGLYNISTNRAASVNEICTRLAAITGSSATFKYGPTKEGEVRHVRLDNHLVSSWWKPHTTLDAGLRLTVESWKEVIR